MTNKELKKMNRRRLLQMLLEIERENETLRARNDFLEAQMKKRELAIAKSGSIAEAALKLNGIFEAAQRAADQYLFSPQKGGSADG